jgi:hypothetical protein
MAHDPAVTERMMQTSVESETALSQLESAMEHADEAAKTTASVLAPPPPPPASEPPKGD